VPRCEAGIIKGKGCRNRRLDTKSKSTLRRLSNLQKNDGSQTHHVMFRYWGTFWRKATLIKKIGDLFTRPYIVISLSLFFTSEIMAANLSYTLSDLPRDINSNVRALLGELPVDKLSRAAYVYTAPKRIENALAALGYHNADIHIVTNRSHSKWVMDVDIVLNEPSRISNVDVKLHGEARADSDFVELLASISISKGDVVHHGKYELLKSSIIYLGLKNGYFEGEIVKSRLMMSENYKTGSISIHYRSGPRYRFGDVIFDEVKVEQNQLDLLLPFKTGEYYQANKLHVLQNQLQQTGFFSTVLVRPDRTNSQNFHVPINVSLTDAKSHYFDFGVGFATDTDFRVSAGWRMPVVNQYGHSLETQVKYSKINPTGGFTYDVPLTHPNDDRMRFHVVLEDDEYGDLESRYLSTQLGRVRKVDSWVRNPYIRYLDEKWDVISTPENANYVLPGLTWTRTRKAGPTLDPSSGFSQLYTVEGAHADAGSEISFLRFIAKWKWITSFADKHRVVTRADIGANLIDKDDEEVLAPSLRFFAGGDQSIRGFEYQSLGPSLTIDDGIDAGKDIVVGGKYLVVASMEYQYSFKQNWRWVLFSDGGNAFKFSKFSAEYSVGIGLHWISPVGAIRFDLGYPLSDEDASFRIHFNVGSEL
jgi:translocation and assembly module TamA